MEVLQFTWITYLEQLTCQSKRQRSQLHRIQETTENFRLPSGLQRIVTSLITTLYKYFYILINLLA